VDWLRIEGARGVWGNRTTAGETRHSLGKQDRPWGNNTDLGESIKKFGKSNIHAKLEAIL